MSHGFLFWGTTKEAMVGSGLGMLLCSVTVAQEITTSRVPGVNFSKYHTYRWAEVKGQHPDSTLDAQIKQAVDSQLGTQGLTKTNDVAADLDVDCQTAISQRHEWQAYEDWTQTFLIDRRISQRKQVTIEMGTLVIDIDIYDTAGKLLVWTGRAHKAIDVNSRGHLGEWKMLATVSQSACAATSPSLPELGGPEYQ